MNFEERKSRIFGFLTNRPDGLLTRYKRPDYLSDDGARAEMADLVDDLNSNIPVCQPALFDEYLAQLKINLRQIAMSRTWPSIPLYLKALNTAVDKTRRAAPPGSQVEEPLYIYDLVKKHWLAVKAPLPSTAKEHHAIRLVQEGLAKFEELRIRGFPMPDIETRRILSSVDYSVPAFVRVKKI